MKLKLFVLFLLKWLFIFSLFAQISLANAVPRVALVIGNKDYAKSPLTNPINDAQDMKAALEKIGFQVVYRENADLVDIDGAVHQFKSKLTKESIGLVYYSGHGAQADGVNYLIPVRTEINSKAELKARAYDAGIILAEMQEAGNPVNILILDACRNNPFKGFKSGADGLNSMSGPRGSLIAFATAPNSVAQDGTERNGLYTKYLKYYLTQPGLKIEEVFKKVRQAVIAESPEQTPWENSSLTGDLCLAGCNTPTSQPITSQPEPVVETKPAPAPEIVKTTETVMVKPVPVSPVLEPQSLPIAPVKLALKSRQRFEPEMIAIRGGCFQMGSTETEADRDDNEKQHQVCVKDFAIGRYEITQAQWQAIMGSNPSEFKGDKLPVEQISWDDAQQFITKLNQQTGKEYRLPTEAEWEYAARAGSITPFYTGQCINIRQANYNGDDYHRCEVKKSDIPKEKTVAVGSYRPNHWKLYDMAGNVAEWTCSDYEDQYNGAEFQCSSISKKDRVVRGGSWDHDPKYLRSAYRKGYAPDERKKTIGFRIAHSLSHVDRRILKKRKSSKRKRGK